MKLSIIGLDKMGANMSERLRRGGHEVVGYDRDPELSGLLSEGDLVVDGGNSNFPDSQRHAALLAEHGIGFVDAGVSGGDWGLASVRGYADDSGEGRWTVEEAIANAVPVPAISAALFARFASRQDDSPAMKAIATLRNQFGGHAVQSS